MSWWFAGAILGAIAGLWLGWQFQGTEFLFVEIVLEPVTLLGIGALGSIGGLGVGFAIDIFT